jgi:hypothetical protein
VNRGGTAHVSASDRICRVCHTTSVIVARDLRSRSRPGRDRLPHSQAGGHEGFTHAGWSDPGRGIASRISRNLVGDLVGMPFIPIRVKGAVPYGSCRSPVQSRQAACHEPRRGKPNAT